MEADILQYGMFEGLVELKTLHLNNNNIYHIDI